MGQNDQEKGQPQNTAPEREGKEFPRSGEAESSNTQNEGQERSTGATAGAEPDAGKDPLGSTIPDQTQGSWRPADDPATGDIDKSSDREGQSETGRGTTGDQQ